MKKNKIVMNIAAVVMTLSLIAAGGAETLGAGLICAGAFFISAGVAVTAYNGMNRTGGGEDNG